MGEAGGTGRAVHVRERLGAALSEFENGVTARLLAGTPLTGATREEWAASRASVSTLWRLLAAVGSPGAAANGPSAAPVEVPPASGAPFARPERIPLAEAFDRIQREHDAVAGFLARVEQAWNAGFPAMQAAARAADRADAIAERELGGADLGRAAFRAEYECTAGLLRSDPLAAAALAPDPDPDPAPAPPEAAAAAPGDGPIAALGRSAEALAYRVREAAELRLRFAERRTQLADASAAARKAVVRAEGFRAATAERIASGVPPQLTVPAPLTQRSAGPLDAVDAVHRDGDWESLPAAVADAEDAYRGIAAQAEQLERECSALLARRDELRGRLDAYTARAARVGRAEQPHIDRLQQEAGALLWIAPCDLAAAAAAVERFRRALAAPAGAGQPPPSSASPGQGSSGGNSAYGTHGKEAGG